MCTSTVFVISKASIKQAIKFLGSQNPCLSTGQLLILGLTIQNGFKQFEKKRTELCIILLHCLMKWTIKGTLGSNCGETRLHKTWWIGEQREPDLPEVWGDQNIWFSIAIAGPRALLSPCLPSPILILILKPTTSHWGWLHWHFEF